MFGPQWQGSAVDFATARQRTDAVLARPEFRHVTEEAYWQLLLARFTGWVRHLFAGAHGFGRFAAWIGPVIEWGFCLALMVGALLWGMRVLRRQRLKIALDAPAAVRDQNEAVRRWTEAARGAADAGEWREAVHALYWACVVELEGRKVWRQVRERTPREYLRLLGEGSPYMRSVRGLTHLLERIWYGLAEAERGDYERAAELYDEVRGV